MTRASLAGWTIATGFLLLAVVSGRQVLRDEVAPASTPVRAEPTSAIDVVSSPGYLYGRVTTTDGAVREGRLRFGGDEEALWTHFFNGRKVTNAWADAVPAGELVLERPLEIFGIPVGSVERTLDLERPFMVRFGDIARIDAERRRLHVTLRSGDVVTLDRFEADDFADGIRVWEDDDVVDLDEWSVRSVEFLPTPEDMTGPAPLRGTVRTESGEFSGLLQWNREASLVDDALEGVDAEGDAIAMPFARVRSVARTSGDALDAVLVDGRTISLTAIGGAFPHRGIYVDDDRYGRVLVAWNAVEEVEFDADAARTVPGRDAFDGGAPLRGVVTTRSGERHEGRIVHDLDESRTIETLDAPRFGVDYMLPLGRVESIEPVPPASDGRPTVRVTLAGGEILRLEAEGDLGPGVPGLLIFPEEGAPAFVPWSEVARVDLERDGSRR